jgi:transcription-repair coupling factor (superfamily II helicase)
VTISTEEEKSDMVDELIDRYGEPPKAVSNLVEVSYFRNLASNLGIYNVTLDDGWITFNSNYLTDADVKALSKSFKGKMCSNLTTDKSFITIEVPSNMEVLTLVEKVLKTLK